MTSPNPTLLMTRPDAQSRRFFGQLPPAVRDRVELLVSPLIDIEHFDTPISLAGVNGIIFSSAHGVAAASGSCDRRDLAAFCVGNATTQAARHAGWPADCFGKTAEEVVANLLSSKETGPLLHLSGRHTRGDIADCLTRNGCPTRNLAVYDQVLRSLSDAARLRIAGKGMVFAPVFSPRTARQLVNQSPVNTRLHLVALSAAVARPLTELGASSLAIAAEPSAKSMGQALESELNRVCRVESNRGAQ